MTPQAASTAAHAMSVLFARYIAGQIADQPFEQLAELFDETEASHEDRAAFARYYLDAADDTVALPTASEINHFLAIGRC
jgi:hypothetical protein